MPGKKEFNKKQISNMRPEIKKWLTETLGQIIEEELDNPGE